MQSRKNSIEVSYEQHAINICEEAYFTIESTLNSFFLKNETKSYKKGDNLRITGSKYRKDDVSMLWMIKPINTDRTNQTDLVVTIEDYEAKLEVGKQNTNQKFEIFRIKDGKLKIKDCNDFMLALDGILQSNDYQESPESQVFIIREVPLFHCGWLANTLFIMTENKKQCLDLENGAREDEEKIALFKVNYRLNQRFIFEEIKRDGDNSICVYLKNALSKLYVIYSSLTHGLAQTEYPEAWKIEYVFKDSVRIYNMKQNKFLSYNEQGGVILSPQPRRWILLNCQSLNIDSKRKMEKVSQSVEKEDSS